MIHVQVYFNQHGKPLSLHDIFRNLTNPSPSYTDRQVQIIHCAMKLMGEGGIQLLTTKNLAREVGVTEPALYRHFRNKVDILKQVLEYLRYRIVRRLEEILSQSVTPAEKIRSFVSRQFKAFTHRPEVVVVLLSEGLYQNNPELSALVYSIMQESAGYYTRAIEEGQISGDFRKDIPAERLSFMLMGSMRFCVIQWHLAGYTYDLNEKGTELTDALLKILQVRS